VGRLKLKAWSGASGIAMLLAGCGSPTSPQASSTAVAAIPRRTPVVEQDRELGGLMLQAEADTQVSGERPRLYVSCAFGPSLSFDLIEPPARTPPLTGVRAAVEIGRDRYSAELSIADPKTAVWTLRDRSLSAKLARETLRSIEVRLTPPKAFGPNTLLVWSLQDVAGPLDKMRESCR